MSRWKVVSLGLAVVGAGVAVAAAVASYQRSMREAEAAWRQIASRAPELSGEFDSKMISGLPEIGQRYFTHAIAPGTPLRTSVQLQMKGVFLLGEKGNHQTYEMRARQILAPPSEFVWIPQLRSGVMRISGSDALVGGSAWTRFWLLGLIPVANEASSEDLVRSAIFRSSMEGIWAPASLLPQRGVRWEQTGPNEARVTIGRVAPPIVLYLTLAPNGALRSVVGQRWSNANPEKVFRLQPFGGTIEGEREFDGYTIPTVVRVGNHFGTAEYLPFFQAEVTRALFGNDE